MASAVWPASQGGSGGGAGCPRLYKLVMLVMAGFGWQGWAGSGWQGWKQTAMSSRCARILAAGGAAVLVASPGVTTALAATATTWTIQPGGTITATATRFTFTDTTTDNRIPCRSSTASGTLKSGIGLPGSHAGSLSTVSIATCSGASGPNYTLRPGALPWHVNLSSYNAAKGVARGTISHLHIALTGAGCSAILDGTGATADDGHVTFKYADSTGQLTVLTTGSNLHFYNVTGCLGLVNTGDPATLSATYPVTPKQAITSP